MPLNITTSTVIPAGEVHDFPYSATDYQGSDGIVLNSSDFNGPPLVLTNRGELKFSPPVTVDRAALIMANSSGAWWDGVIENYGSMSISGGSVYLLWSSWTPRLINAGQMTAVGTSVTVIQGDQVKGQSEALPALTNSGEIHATGSGNANGVWFNYASTIVNSGLISASVLAGGKGAAVAISVGDGSVIRNSGTIIADDADPSSERSTAIAFSGSSAKVLIVNNGLIQADKAIVEGNSQRPDYALTQVENYKDIVGKVLLGLGNDTLINRGHITGDVDLGDQDDLYDGVGGHVTGVVHGGAGADRFLAGTGAERYDGGTGDDTFMQGLGADVFDGGAGFDTVDLSQLTTGVTLSLASTDVQILGGGASLQLSGVESVIGTAFADHLTGAVTADVIDGGAGDDVLDGGAGADTLIGGAGADTMRGGAGADTFVFKVGSGADVIQDFDVTQDTIDASDHDGYQSMTLRQDGADTIITFTATDSVRVVGVQASALADHIKLLDLTPKVLNGGSGADFLIGGMGNDTLNGGAGDDTLVGGYGDDLFDGGPGHNKIDGGPGVDTVTYEYARGPVYVTGAGADGVMSASVAADNGGSDYLINIENVIGTAYDDILGGSAANNRLEGRDGNDIIYGGDGDDQLIGGAGDDQLQGGPGNDLLDGGPGVDKVDYSNAKGGVHVDLSLTGPQDTIGAGIDTIIGVENILGSSFADVLIGNASNNIFQGGGGSDVIDGGAGVDTIYLGALNTYQLTAMADGAVIIKSLGQTDQITVRNVEIGNFNGQVVALTLDPASASGVAVASLMRASPVDATQRGLAADILNATFANSSRADITKVIVKAAGATTSVASLAYEFFTGKVPSQAGVDYLVSPTGPNANNLNSAYYQSFNLENRYINFAVNLGKVGEGAAAFTANYGAMTLFDATRKAYAAIFGATPTDTKIHAMIDSRADYFASYGGDGANGIGTKAAMVGWLLAEAQKADLGVMVKSNDAWLTDLADGSAPFAIDILDPAKGYYKADFAYGGT